MIWRFWTLQLPPFHTLVLALLLLCAFDAPIEHALLLVLAFTVARGVMR